MIIAGFIVLLVIPAFSQNVDLTLIVPSTIYGPGSPFSLNLNVTNHGESIADVQLFIVLSLGKDDFRFYPSWVSYPPGLDWIEIDIAESSQEVIEIIPEFSWPAGVGNFSYAKLLSAITQNGNLISNIAEATFSWAEAQEPVMVYIPPGTFNMGAPDTEVCRDSDEGPVHTVTLTHGFYMQETEVTQRQWVNIFNHNPSEYQSVNRPVETISWFEACVYCNRMSVAMGLTPCYYEDTAFRIVMDRDLTEWDEVYWNREANGYRLPTEAEWEYACRAGTTTAFSNGTNSTRCDDGVEYNLHPLAWYYMNAGHVTQPVKQKQPNNWNLYDMHGNIREWCWDFIQRDYYSTSPSVDPTGPDVDYLVHRIARGGSYFDFAYYCRSAWRGGGNMDSRYYEIGFRIVRTAQ